jgi:hypothetical protein
MAPPLPNSAHGDQLISAKPRGTARFCATFICDALETDWLAGVAGFELAHLDQRRPFEVKGISCDFNESRHQRLSLAN